jgi:hypothetical protein
MFRKHGAGGGGMDGSFRNFIGSTHGKLSSYIVANYSAVLQKAIVATLADKLPFFYGFHPLNAVIKQCVKVLCQTT